MDERIESCSLRMLVAAHAPQAGDANIASSEQRSQATNLIGWHARDLLYVLRRILRDATLVLIEVDGLALESGWIRVCAEVAVFLHKGLVSGPLAFAGICAFVTPIASTTLTLSEDKVMRRFCANCFWVSYVP